MVVLTRTPELEAYAVATLAVLGAAPLALTAHVYARWLASTRIRVLDLYSAVAAVIVVWGVLLVGPTAAFGAPHWVWLPLAAAGALAGLPLSVADRDIVRRYSRRTARAAPAGVPPQAARWYAAAPVVFGEPRRARRRRGITRTAGRRATAAVVEEFGLATVLAVAVVEELLYRGVLVALCQRPENALMSAIALAAVLAAFALSHVWFGWAHVLSKLPLGAFALATVVATGTVVAAVAAHMAFNVLAWRRVRAEGVV